MKFNHRQVAFIEAKGALSRCGEGSFIRLQNGDIMLIYTEYNTTDFSDDASACLAALVSHDEGESWGEHRVILEKNEGDLNVMSVSLLRLPNGEILLMYLKKSTKNGLVLCQPFVRRSNDDGATFGAETICGPRDKYYVVNNDRVILLKSGRILMPAAVYDSPKHGEALSSTASVCMIASDDNGYSWTELENETVLPVPHRSGFEEPGLYEHEDGTVWCYMRTRLGCQWQMLSTDQGESWSTPRPNMLFTSPDSPMLVKKVCGLTVAVFNPEPKFISRPVEIWGRTPLMMLAGEADGVGHDLNAFPYSYMIETDRSNNYCYPAILEGNGYFLLSYYHSNGTNCPLNSLKIVKITVERD